MYSKHVSYSFEQYDRIACVSLLAKTGAEMGVLCKCNANLQYTYCMLPKFDHAHTFSLGQNLTMHTHIQSWSNLTMYTHFSLGLHAQSVGVVGWEEWWGEHARVALFGTLTCLT